jgi:mRNA interferase MazF
VTRGEVYWADLAPRSGSEQRGRRPVIVVSHDAFNQARAWRSVVVVPISTSSSQAARGPTIVPLAPGSGGLRKPCYAVCHQVTTLDRSKVLTRIGTLSRDSLARVAAGLKAALDLA